MRVLCVGDGGDLARVRALLAARGHDLVEAGDLQGVLAALARGPTPDIVVAVPRDGATVPLIRAVRSHVRGEQGLLLALVPEAALEEALDAGADLALPVSIPGPVLLAAIAAQERCVARPRRGADDQGPGHDLYFLRNPHPMWFFDVDTLRFVAVNDAALAKYGYTREEFLAMTIKDIRPPEELDRLLRVTGRVALGLNETPGWRHRAKDGRIFDVEIIGYPVRYAGRPCELILVHDVSERRVAESKLEELRAQLAISDRMAAIGTLAAGVAHEINNPLTWILANVTFAAEQLERFAAPSPADARAVREALDEAVDGTARVRAIVRDLKTFSRSEEEGIGPVDLVRVAASALNLAANEVRHRARVFVEVGEAPLVLGNEARLGQVLLNLIVNAAHAIPDGRASEEEIRVTARRAGDRVDLRVSDSGSGVDPAHAPRIFDPFFTTKPAGQGTGLGLWVCRRLIEGLGGTIELLPPAGRGATFRILLPAAEAAPHAPAGSPPPPPDAGRRARVLVVDDEPLVGRALVRSLGTVAEVEVETSGRTALERLARGERFDLVLSDVMMPDLAGAEFHAGLLRLDPALARSVVFMTGGAFSPAEQEFLARIPNTCLEKPLDLRRLRELVRAAAG